MSQNSETPKAPKQKLLAEPNMSQTYIYYVHGMTCVSCSGSIESGLKNIYSNTLEHFHVDLTETDPKKTIIILSDNDRKYEEIWSEMKLHIDEMGFNCENYVDANNDETDNTELSTSEEQPENTLKNRINQARKLFSSHWALGILGCIAGIAVLIACLLASSMPMALMLPLATFSTLLTLTLGAKSYYDAWYKWNRSYTLTMDTLFALSTIAILIVSIASLFVPWLPMMFEAGLLIYGFRHIGIAIENSIKEKIGSAKFQDRAPKKARRSEGNDYEEVLLTDINPNDTIIVAPGEIIPLDGICEEESIIYNTIITGATLPRYFHQHEKVLAGMRLAENASPLKIRVTRIQKKSYLARLDTRIEQSIFEKAPIEIKTGKLLNYFIPTVIALAILSGIVVGIFFTPAVAIQCAVSVLVSACPCTLGLIIPLAVKTGMHKAAEHGVQFKNAKTLQLAEQIDTVIFDLNGTLTTGIPVIKQFNVLDNSGLSQIDLLTLCSALEKKSNHPIGKAIYSFAKHNNRSEPEVEELDESHHAGLTGQIDGTSYTIGSITLMQEKNISLPDRIRLPELDAGDHTVFIARDNTVIGYMIITDPLRDDACRTINALVAMGKKVHICTGADEQTAQRYARVLGIQNVHANCLATSMQEGEKSKTAYVNLLKSQGHKVTLVGDAANDAPAIAACDMGIAVSSFGSDELTQQEAGAVIHTGSLLPIASIFAISRQTVSNINQNLLMSFGYNLGTVLVSGGVLITAGMALSPVIGVALMIVQACIILLNVYRFKQQELNHLQDETNTSDEDPLHCSSHWLMHQHTPIYNNELTEEHHLSSNSYHNESTSDSFENDDIPGESEANGIELLMTSARW